MKSTSEIRICSRCIEYRSMHKLERNKNALGCEKGIWKITIQKFNKENWDKKMDIAKTCKHFEAKSSIIRRRK